MVVRRGQEWGSPGRPPAGVPVALDDTHASRLVRTGCREFVVASGDMALTVGAVPPETGSAYRRLPLDLLMATLIDGDGHVQTIPVFSHCVIRSSLWKGGLFSGPITLVCNAQFIEGRDVAPRGHPNDGKVEILEISSELGPRERVHIFHRMRNGNHLPHPSIRFRQVSTATDFETKGVLIIDGVRQGHVRFTGVDVLPDAVTAWVALPSATDTSVSQD
jgi:hypothetical protein